MISGIPALLVFFAIIAIPLLCGFVLLYLAKGEHRRKSGFLSNWIKPNDEKSLESLGIFAISLAAIFFLSPLLIIIPTLVIGGIIFLLPSSVLCMIINQKTPEKLPKWWRAHRHLMNFSIKFAFSLAILLVLVLFLRLIASGVWLIPDFLKGIHVPGFIILYLVTIILLLIIVIKTVIAVFTSINKKDFKEEKPDD